MELIYFLASQTGRWVREVVGGALFAVGLLALEGTVGIVVGVIGLVPLLAGMFDICLLAPLFGASLSGRRIRAQRAAQLRAEESAEEYDEEPVEEV